MNYGLNVPVCKPKQSHSAAPQSRACLSSTGTRLHFHNQVIAHACELRTAGALTLMSHMERRAPRWSASGAAAASPPVRCTSVYHQNAAGGRWPEHPALIQ